MLESNTLTYQCHTCGLREVIDTSITNRIDGRICKVCGKCIMPIGPAFRPKVLVVAANATQAKENWKNIKEYYSPDAYVHFASNRRCMLDGMNHLNRLGDCNLTIVLCGEYWKNIFYESELYWIWKKYGVPMIDVKDL